MRTRSSKLFALIISGLFMISLSLVGTAQTVNPEVVMKFTRQANGKVAIINAVDQKVFNFQVVGLITSTDVDNFKNKFLGRQGVVSMTIADQVVNGERSGNIIFARGTKGTYIRDLLVKAGINQIYIDGDVKPVDEIGQ
jgi:hypothetical protein